MITTFYPPFSFGGDGVFVHQLSNELAKRGHCVDVIHCIDAYRLLARGEHENTYNNHPNVTMHGLKSRFGFLSPIATQQTGYPFFKSTQVRQILEKGFDVIHYHNISLVGGPKILEYGQGIKLYTMHEYWLICPTHVLYRFKRTACTKRNCFFCTLMHKRPPQLWRYTRLLEAASKNVDVFIALSHFLKDKYYEMGFNFPIVHLPPFVSAQEATPRTYGHSIGELPGKPYFLFVGRLEKIKGVHTLIPVFQQYDKARLLIAGTGSYEPRLRELAGRDANIEFLGHQSERQLQSLYHNAVALIHPSLCFEVFGLVNLEAFRERTPVIMRNMGGMPELVEESGGGLVYTSDGDLIAAMDHLMTSPSLCQELGTRGYDAYTRNWTAETHIQRYLALVHDVASSKGKGSPGRRLLSPEAAIF